MFMMSRSGDAQDRLNRINSDIRKEQIALDNLQISRKRDIERVEHRYDMDIQRLHNTLKRLTREADDLQKEVDRNKK